MEPSLKTLTWHPDLEPRKLFKPLLGTLTWNLGISWNLYAEPLLGTLEPSETLPLLGDPLLEPLLGTLKPAWSLTWNLILGTSEPSGTFTWNPLLEPWNLLDPLLGSLLGTITENLGTSNFPEPLLGTLAWKFVTSWIFYLEPLPGTSEPSRTLLGTTEPPSTLRDDRPRVPQGLAWLRPQSFQPLGKKTTTKGL